MQKTTLYIIWLGLLLSLASIGNFLTAVFHVPVYIIAALMIAVAFFSYRSIRREAKSDTTGAMDKKALIILSGGIILITAICAILVRKHGDTDAIGNWNFAAKYLSDTPHWKQIFWYSPEKAHADYPMGYFGAIAFFWRLFGTQNEIVSLAITYFATLCIPVIIFFELWKKHLAIATVILLMFIFNPYYLNTGLNQYADTLLAFYMLSAFIAMNHYQKSHNRIFLILCVASLGACLWVKNEGIFTCAAFGLFYFRTFFSKKNIRVVIASAAVFVLTWVFFKLAFKPANDVLARYKQGTGLVAYLTDKTRYKLIFDHLSRALNGNFSGLKLLAMVFAAYSILAQKLPGKNLAIVCTILAIYLGVNVITPIPLDFFLATSLERLLVQLYPSFLLIIGLELSEIKIPQAATEEQK